jgi:hypothetical protein
VRRRESEPHQIDGGDSGDAGDAVNFRTCMLQFIVASAILVPIIGVAPTWAQMIRIPNSEMPGRERERFVDPLPRNRSPARG